MLVSLLANVFRSHSVDFISTVEIKIRVFITSVHSSFLYTVLKSWKSLPVHQM